ncbi:uncharacterized protein [Macrobrachium rosenbergii]|uniref:uncharacterized protein n=1 Tax=Macrobrachium rosenbergii TaxID=79674 RepID=UPI0034D618C7
MRMWLALERQRILEHTLDITLDTGLSVNEVLDALQEHIKSLHNENLHCRELLTCKQLEGESFSDFYTRYKNIAEEVDVCPSTPSVCEQTKMKIIILMGIMDEELTEKLIALDTNASLQDIIDTCCTYEVTRKVTSAIVLRPLELQEGCHPYHTMTEYFMPVMQPHARIHREVSSSRQHLQQLCPQGALGQGTELPCQTGPVLLLQPTGTLQQVLRCRKKTEMPNRDIMTSAAGRRKGMPNRVPLPVPSLLHPLGKNPSCLHMGRPSSIKTLQSISVSLSYGYITSRSQMLPDVGADVSVTVWALSNLTFCAFL